MRADQEKLPRGMHQYMQNTLGLASTPCYSTRSKDIQERMQQNEAAAEKQKQARTRAANKKTLQQERTVQRQEKQLLHKATTPWQRGRSLRNKTTNVVSDKPSCQKAEIKRSQCHWKAKPQNNVRAQDRVRQGGNISSAAASRSRHTHMRTRAEAAGAWPRGQTTPAKRTDEKPPAGVQTPMPNEYGNTPTPETGTRAARQRTNQPAQKEPGFNTDGAADPYLIPL